jgi:glutamyl-Q tRNA(Asp) synthetase
LQRSLVLPTPQYLHVPVLAEPDGSKLAKSARAVPADQTAPRVQLLKVLRLLQLEPPRALEGAPVSELWGWAQAHWAPIRLSKGPTLHLEG